MKIPLPLVLITLLSGCSGTAADQNPVPEALVGVAPAVQGSVNEQLTLYGTAEIGAEGRFDLVAPIEARVASIAAPVGTPVARGQLVVLLTASPTSRLDLARAVNDATLAEQALERARRLRTDGLASDADVETAVAAARSSRAASTNIQMQTRGLRLTAPTSGTVNALPLSVGSLVAPGGVVATVARGGSLRARFGLNPADSRRIVPGMPLRITTASGASSFTTPILSVDTLVDPATRLVSLRAAIPIASGIGGGETLEGQVAISTPAQGLTIPYAALLDEGGQPFVFVVTRGVAHRRNIVTGAADQTRVAVIEGLRVGDVVVISGATALQDGVRVRTR